MPSPPLRYRVLIVLLMPFIVLLTLWQAWKVRDKRFALHRLGFSYLTTHRSPLWVHCASVGEMRAALPLINQLRADSRFSPVLVSTATPTGGDVLLQQGWDDIEHVYLPIDSKAAVKRAFKQLKPRAVLLMETEIWPHLINTARRLELPVAIINGRLSQRTMRTPEFLMPVYQQALEQVTLVLAKSDIDKQRFEQLGAPKPHVQSLGNLKFAALSTPTAAPANALQRPFWLAASTHHDEEKQLCSAWLTRQPSSTDLLVIAPRHPKRSARIQNQLKDLRLNFAVRSAGDEVNEQTQVYLADTLSEMPLWLHHAKVVFMGGSLVPIGGHNVLEPAAAGVPIVSGPHLHNFLEEAELLIPSGALHQADSAEEAIDYVNTLLANPDHSRVLGVEGFKAVQTNADMLERYIDALLPLVGTQQ